MKKTIIVLLTLCLLMTMVAGCRKVDRVSSNVSKEADNFNVYRKVTVINARNDTVLLEIQGTLSIKRSSGDIDIICLVGEGVYKKHFVSLNSWTVYVVEDISGADVSPYHYEITIYPKMSSTFSLDAKWD